MSREDVLQGRPTEFAAQHARVLQALLDHVADGVVAFDQEGRPVAFNAAAARILGVDLAQTTAAQWAERATCHLPDRKTVCPPEKLPVFRAMRGETVRETLLFVRYPEKPSGFWVSVSAEPRRRSDGLLEGAVVVVRDIDEAQRARLALQRNEGMFRSLIENVLDIIAVLNAKGTVLFISPAVEGTLGYLPQELIGRNAFDLVHQEDLPKVLSLFRSGVKNPGSVAVAGFRYRHKDGSWRFLTGAGRNLLDNPDIAGVVVVARDVTERLRAEREALFQVSLMQHLRSAVIALDAEGRITYWNNFAWKLHHWTLEQVQGKEMTEVVIPPPGRGRYQECLRKTQETGHSEGEFDLQRRDGSRYPALLTIAAVRDKPGTLIGYVVVALDITEHKEAEERLRASREQLRELAAHCQATLESERARIARDIHDELGQQLTAAKMGLFHMLKEPGGKAAWRNQESNIKSMIDLVDSSITSVQRIAAELRPSVLDSLGLAAAIEWQLRDFQSRTRIRCSMNRQEEDLPLDPNRRTQVFRIFQEVMTNIARHSYARAVTVVMKRENDDLVLEVRDNGVGITRRQITNPRSLGLLGMRERALQLNGELSVRGIRGKGTCVTLRIPIDGRKGDRVQNTDSG